jgi:PadR family transcriptional regulator PadR
MNSQFKKGALELCVLSMLTREDRYGYELTDAISKQMEIASGTLYLVLRRLKEENLVTTYLRESDNGPARKYYHLTDEGRDYQKTLKDEWLSFVGVIDKLLAENE